MPYFKKNNILLIHIPKTGGTSLEIYFSRKYALKLEDTLFSRTPSQLPEFKNRYLQHLFLTEYKEHNELLGIDFCDSLQILAITRNPYDRLISALLYGKKITLTSDPAEVYSTIQHIFSVYTTSKKKIHYGHYIPQWEFIADNEGAIDPRVTVMDTETLMADMHALGFTDFSIHMNGDIKRRTNYRQLLNSNSLQLINTFYERDFTLFNYPRLEHAHT
jgi:hypothetical protein